MKIEVKALKIARSLSEETTAYTADIYVDGVKTFAASNHGHGGCDFYHRYEGAKVTEAEVNAWLAENVAPDGPFEPDPAKRADYDNGSPCSLESFMARGLAAEEANHELKRITKKFDAVLAKSVAALNADGHFVTFKAAPTPANIEAVRKAKPDYVIVNGADAATREKALNSFCPDLASLAVTDDEEAVYERMRENRLTAADARWLLKRESSAALPCADTIAMLTRVAEEGEAREAAYKEDRMQRAARDAAGALIGQVS